MLTIPMMVRVGAWTVTSRERTSGAVCQRCKKKNLKNVWVCEVDPGAVDRLNVLHGQRVWRIGSECGDQLEGVSESMWKAGRSRTDIAFRYATLRDRARAEAYDLPAVIIEHGEALLANTVDESRLKWLSGVMTSHRLKLNLDD